MKQTNYYLYDFLDFIQEPGKKEYLWKACKPTDIKKQNSDVIITLPFQKQKCSHEIVPDTGEKPENYSLKLQGYGDKILRISAGFDVPYMDDSPMLELSPDLKISPLNIEKRVNEWIVRDGNGNKKACFNLKKPETDFWSDLQPEPRETLDATFYPDGLREVRLSAYDQFHPARYDAMALAYIEKQGKIKKTTISFHADHDEVFAGTGERFAKTDLSGSTYQLQNQDSQGVNNRRTYKNVPFYISSNLYGMFLHTSAHSKFSFADHSARSVLILAEHPLLDIFLIGGSNIEEIVYQYRKLTGFPGMPPLWSFGTWMSRMTYFSAEEVTDVCNRLRNEDYPCDVINLDTGWFKTDWVCEWKFSNKRFPDPAKFISELKSKGFRLSLWQLPYIATEAEQYDEAVKNKYIGIKNSKKKQSDYSFSTTRYAGTIDFTYPKAVNWYKGLLRKLLKMGVACIKADFGEDIHMNAEYHAMEPELLHNLYALLYQKAVFEVTKEVTGEGIIWARAGCAGCQRYPLHWGGDAASSWDGMAGSLKGGLHLGLSGFGFWSHDVPGYHGVPDFMNSVIQDELYLRWTQFGVFSSHLRYHGTSKREPYHFPNISNIVRRWLKLRYCLIPYIFEQGKAVTKTGYPLLRALIFHHADDRVCWHIHDEYYFGNDFFVAPVMNPYNKRDVYLPAGKWINLFDGTLYTGSQWLKDFKVSLEEMPVWVKYRAKVPVYTEHVKCTDEMDLSKSEIIQFDDSYKGIYKSKIGKIIK
jgi:alpha-D-xyloside xylohydrolase